MYKIRKQGWCKMSTEKENWWKCKEKCHINRERKNCWGSCTEEKEKKTYAIAEDKRKIREAKREKWLKVWRMIEENGWHEWNKKRK